MATEKLPENIIVYMRTAIKNINKKDPKDTITKRSSNGMLTGVELNIGDIYTIRVKNNDNYVFEQDIEIRDMDGDTVAFKVGTEEPVFQLDLVAKT